MADYPYTRLTLPDGQYAINYPGRNTEPTEEHPDGRQSQLALEAASFLPGIALNVCSAGPDTKVTCEPALSAAQETTLDAVVADHQANANPLGLIDDATGDLLVWGYTDPTPGAGETKMTDIPRPAYALGQYGATQLSRWTGTAWEYVAQP
jgi:hypothetical protein